MSQKKIVGATNLTVAIVLRILVYLICMVCMVALDFQRVLRTTDRVALLGRDSFDSRSSSSGEVRIFLNGCAHTSRFRDPSG